MTTDATEGAARARPCLLCRHELHDGPDGLTCLNPNCEASDWASKAPPFDPDPFEQERMMQQQRTPLECARLALLNLLTGQVQQTIDATRELPPPPETLAEYGRTIELVKRGAFQVVETRTALADTMERLKGAHSDEARGGKETLNDAARSRLREALLGDADYCAAQDADAVLRQQWALWDARRSRLNRDFEAARLDAVAGYGVTPRDLGAMVDRLTAAADMLASTVDLSVQGIAREIKTLAQVQRNGQ